MVWKELAEALVDDFISVALTVVVLYMAVTQMVVPEWLIAAFSMILVFYFKKE